MWDTRDLGRRKVGGLSVMKFASTQHLRVACLPGDGSQLASANAVFPFGVGSCIRRGRCLQNAGAN